MNLSVRVRGATVFYEPDLGPEFLRFVGVRQMTAPLPAVRSTVGSEKSRDGSAMAQCCLWTHWSVLVAGLLAVLLVVGGCERQGTSGGSTVEAAEGPTPKHVSWDAQFTMSEGGRPRAVIAAPRMEQYRTSDSTYSVWRSMSDTTRVRLYLYDSEGDSSATLTADSLVFQDRKGLLDAYRNVVVVTENNKRLHTEHLVWRQADRKIRTRRFVRIRTPTEVVQGNGLVADEDLETYQLGQFEAEVEVNDDKPEEDE